MSLSSISSSSQRLLASQRLVDNQLAELTEKVKIAVNSRWFVWGKEDLKNQLSALPSERLRNLIDSLILKPSDQEEIRKTVDCLIDLLSLEKLESVVQSSYPDYREALDSAKAMCDDAKKYLQQTQKVSPSVILPFLSSIKNSLLIALEGILSAFGIAQLFEPAEDEMHAYYRGYRLMTLSQLFTLLTSCLIPLLGEKMKARAISIAGGIILTICALSLIYAYIRPAPTRILRTVNWSEEFQRSGSSVFSEARKTVLDEIANTFMTSNQVKTHVMLLGRTGVGKTETAKAFTHAIQQGKYPGLQGKTVFYLNAAELIGSSENYAYGNRTLARIKESMGRHREQIILVIDEIHLVCQHREQSAISEQLKTLLDPSQEGFPYVIGITTEEEYDRDIYINNAAFARRFKCINVENMTPEETQQVLSAELIQQAPDILIERTGFALLQSKIEAAFPQTAAPATHLRILSQCIERVSSLQKIPLEEEMETLRNQIQSERAAAISLHGNDLLPYGSNQSRQKIADRMNDLHHKEALLRETKTQIRALFLKKKQLSWIKQMTYESTLKVTAQTSNISLKEVAARKKRFLLFSHLINPSVVQYIKTQGQQLGVRVEINSSLIDEVILKEKTLQTRMNLIASRGHEEIQGRQIQMNRDSKSAV